MKVLIVSLALLCLGVSDAAAQSIQVLPRAASDPVVVVVADGPGNRMDWVTVTASVSPDNSYVDWFYLNGSKTAPLSGYASATVTFPAPAAGTYNVRLFANNSLAVKLATSAPVTVGSGGSGPPISLQSIVFNGDSITAPQNITGMQNWTAIVANNLGFESAVNLANNDKYAADVLAEVPLMGGQVCMVMIGTNNMVGSVGAGVPADESLAGYLSGMHQIVVGLKARCGRVVILTPPLSLNARETLRYPEWADALRRLCVEQGVTFLNLFQHMADLSAFKPDWEVSSWYSDWRHLTAAGHAVIGDFVSKSLKVTP